MRSGPWSVVWLALLGLVLALVLGAVAHAITRDTVALPSTSLEADEQPLAPPQATQEKPDVRREDRRAGRREESEARAGTTTEAESEDRRGRNRRGRGSGNSGRGGSDHSGSGSDSSGKGSSGSDDD